MDRRREREIGRSGIERRIDRRKNLKSKGIREGWIELPSLGGRSPSPAQVLLAWLRSVSFFSFHPSAVIQNADLIRANLTPSSRSCFGELNPSRRCPPSFRLLSSSSSCASPPENLPSRGENLKFKRKWPSRVVVLVVIVVVVVVVVVVLLLRAIPLF